MSKNYKILLYLVISMKFFLAILIFCLILFLYIHIVYHLKTSNDLDLFEIDKPGKEKLEQICNLRQPFIFKLNNNDLLDKINKSTISVKGGIFDINIRKITNNLEEPQLLTPVSFNSMDTLFKSEKEKKYITEDNNEFLTESMIIYDYRNNDLFLRPYLVSNCNYDYMCGNDDSFTPLRYNLNNRNYYYVTEGEVSIKLICPKHTKHLHLIKDYENFEFKSAINPWNVQEEYKNSFDKITSINRTLKKNDIIYIPPYWWYSIKYTDNKSSVISFMYKTYMNNLAIIPELTMMVLQKLNTKIKIVKKKID